MGPTGFLSEGPAVLALAADAAVARETSIGIGQKVSGKKMFGGTSEAGDGSEPQGGNTDGVASMASHNSLVQTMAQGAEHVAVPTDLLQHGSATLTPIQRTRGGGVSGELGGGLGG